MGAQKQAKEFRRRRTIVENARKALVKRVLKQPLTDDDEAALAAAAQHVKLSLIPLSDTRDTFVTRRYMQELITNGWNRK